MLRSIALKTFLKGAWKNTCFDGIAFLINDGMSQQDRLTKLNKIAIQQMNILNDDSNRKLLK